MLELVRVAAYTPNELAPELNTVVETAAPELLARYSPGTIRRLGGDAIDEVFEYVAHLITRDKQDITEGSRRALFALVPTEKREDGLEVVGLAGVMPQLPVSVYRLPLPPKLMKQLPKRQFHRDWQLGQANITGWSLPDYYPDLGSVYAMLAQEAATSVWTIEPRRANPVIHAAIREALAPTGAPMRYDVGEVGDIIPPVSQAYVHSAV